MAFAKGRKSKPMQKPGGSSSEKLTGATKAKMGRKHGSSMEHCSKLMDATVPKLGTGGIRS